MRDERELAQILRLMLRGAQDREIAAELHLGLRTVERRIRTVMMGHGLRNRFQLGALAVREGWLSSTDLDTLAGTTQREAA